MKKKYILLFIASVMVSYSLQSMNPRPIDPRPAALTPHPDDSECTDRQSALEAIQIAVQWIAQQPVDERWERLRRLFTETPAQTKAHAPETEKCNSQCSCTIQ